MEHHHKTHPHSKKYSATGSILWALRNLWKINHNYIFFMVALIPPSVLLPLAEAFFPKVLLDGIGQGKSFLVLAWLSGGFLLGITLLGLLKGFLQSRYGARSYYAALVYQAAMQRFENCYLDLESTQRQEFKETRGYAVGDACGGRCAAEYFGDEVLELLINLFGIFTYASFLVILDPFLFAVIAVLSVLSYFLARWQPDYTEKHKHFWEKETRKRDYIKGLSEDFSRAKDIKLYGLSGWLNQMLRDYQKLIRQWEGRCLLRGFFAGICAGLAAFVQNGAVYLFLIAQMFAGGMSVGEFVFYFGLVGGIARYFQGILEKVALLHTYAEKISYYRDFFHYPGKSNHGEGCELPAAPVTVEFKDVWYRYDGAKEDTLKGINLVIPGGQKLALVGMNGAGKTTLVKLLCGMYQPSRGEILVGGKRIEEYNIDEYYSIISAVFQEVKAIAITVFEFVASADLNREGAREAAVSAMEAAGIYGKVKSLPNGMDTHLMKGIYGDGVDFSGGEMQRLVLARAIYKDGSILVLDEPTAALDPIAENHLYLKYQELTAGKTSVYISHRFASTRFCDRIVLLADGRIVESGTHEELMEKNGEYARMFGVQSQYYKNIPGSLVAEGDMRNSKLGGMADA